MALAFQFSNACQKEGAMDDLYTLEAIWSDSEEPPRTSEPPVEVLAERLAALPKEQLDAFARTVERCRPAAPALMTWLRDLIRWERARRTGRSAVPAIAHFDRREHMEAVLALGALASQFRENPENFPSPITGPLGLLFDAARNAIEHDSRDVVVLH
jgi:hypothetical protein